MNTLAAPTTRSWQYGFVAALVLLVTVVAVQYGRKIEDPQRSAFERWRPQVLQLHDEDIYARYNYPNPPIMALILLPFAELSPTAGGFLWFFFKVGLTVLSFIWACRLVATGQQPMSAGARVLIACLCLRPIMGDLSHGNVNLFILFLVMGALYAFQCGRDWSAGLLLALSIACKVTPALFLGYFVWKRAWTMVAATSVGLVLFLAVIPAGYLGFGTNLDRLHSWYHRMVEPFVVRGFVTTEHQNQSLPGLAMRLLTHSPSDSRFDEQKRYEPTEYRNLIDLDPTVVRWLIKGCMGAFALAVVWACRSPVGARDGWRLAAEFSLVLLGMLLFSERTWKHHCVTLLLPFTVLVYYATAVAASRAMRLYLGATLAAAALLMVSTVTGTGWSEFGKLSEAYGAYVWAYLLLIGALVLLLRHSGTAAVAVTSSAKTAPFGQPTPLWQKSA